MLSSSRILAVVALTHSLISVQGQAQNPGVGYPMDYPGMPTGDFSPAWQEYFHVTEPLPNVTWPLGRNWAGNIPVDRPGHPNDTLFFWGFEQEAGSLTAPDNENSDKPWGLWLSGGPGVSSMLALLFENGPIHVANNYSLFADKYAWSQLADWIWVDQPVGVGFSTVDNTGFVEDEDQMAEDFFNFLTNLVKVFPSLRQRPLYLTGESYAGTYIPYITKHYFGMKSPPVKLAKIAIGNGAMGNDWELAAMPVVTIIETYPQLIAYDPDVFSYFREQSHLCGLDLNLTYPQHGHFPTLNAQLPSFNLTQHLLKRDMARKAMKADAYVTRSNIKARSLEAGSERTQRKEQWKRDLTGLPNGTIDAWYGCDLYSEMVDYALNFSLPWEGHDAATGFDIYDIPDALEPEAPMDASVFMNDDRTRTALHAPTSKDWVRKITYPFGSVSNGQDPSVRPMAFMSALATNASNEHVGVVIYSGNDDSLVSHRSSEVTIQNTTFGGIQGFTRQPSTPWYDDNGQYAGIVHQERNWTYAIIKGAGHLAPQQQPDRAYVLLREFILGNNSTGLVTMFSGHTSVVGGEDPNFVGVMTGQSGIFVGSGTTQSAYTFPTPTIEAWETFIAEATAI